MANLNLHPATGMGDLLSGWWVVPQNPLQMAREGVTVKRSLGDFVDACFVVPQNPLRDQVYGMVAPLGTGISGTPLKALPAPAGSGMSGLHGDCGCGGTCGGCGGGMGDISADFSKISSDISAGNFANIFSDPIMGIPLWIIAAAGIALVTMGRAKGTMRR